MPTHESPINPQPPVAQASEEQERQQQAQQQQVPAQPVPGSGGGGIAQSLTPAAILNTVRGTAAKTTNILSISSDPDSRSSDNVSGTAPERDTHSAILDTAAAPFASSSSSSSAPTPPPTSSPSPTPAPHPTHTQSSSTRSNQNRINTGAPATATAVSDSGYTIMNPSQSDLMTMESFQMNGGDAFGYDTQEYADPACVAGPGNFREDSNEQHYDLNNTGSRQGSEDGFSEAPTAFVYANEKRFNDFHTLFRSVPEDEKLIEDYGCALQKEILVQGRLYISENHICFNANIFGWVTNLVIAFSEITAIEKRLTAFVIPNAISISTATNTKGHFFASFLSRDAAYDLLMAAWRKSFPCAANASALSNNVYFRQNRSNSALNEDDANNTDADSFISARPTSDSKRNRHRRSSSSGSQNWTADEADWDEFEDVDGTEGGTGRSPPSSFNHGDAPGSQASGRSRAESESPSGNRANDHRHTNGEAKSSTKANGGGNSNRAPTACKCSRDGRHYANTYLQETYPGSVESMWKLLFESEFNKGFLTNEVMKGADVQEEAWQKASDGTLTKTTRYTKWLGMPIGPKTTKAILTDVCENKDFDQYVTTVTTTSTPDVPSGGCFTTKCRTCITWAGPNKIQVLVTGAVEFTKSSWIKGQIEKGAADGMTAHYKELNQCIRKYIAAHPEDFAGGDSGSGTATPLAADSENGHASRSRSKSAGRGRDLDSDRVSSKNKVSVESTASPIAASTVKGDKSGSGGMLSSLFGVFSWGDGESASHLALIGVLLAVMLANIYIWIQISNVSSQIERMQDDVIHQYSKGNSDYGARSMIHRNTGNNNNNKNNNMFFDNDHVAGDYYDSYSWEQEEAMWAWLTEREERHQQYQRANAHKDRIRVQKSGSDPVTETEEDPHSDDTSTTAKFVDLSATEAKLQARINELQQQLETLERALETGAQKM